MGEYEPNDSRIVTGANNQQASGQPQQGSDASISQSPQQGHGQDPGMRGQASSQQQQQQGGSQGQQGGSGQQQQFDQSGARQMSGGDPQHASELNQQARPGGGQQGGQEAQQRAGNQSGVAGQIREHMEVIGADGAHVGTVDHVDGNRIKLTKRDSSAGYEGEQHAGHHHYLSIGLVAGVEGNTVRLSANGDVAFGMEEEEGE